MDVDRARWKVRDVIRRFEHVMMIDTEHKRTNHSDDNGVEADIPIPCPKQYSPYERQSNNDDIDKRILKRRHHNRKVVVSATMNEGDDMMRQNKYGKQNCTLFHNPLRYASNDGHNRRKCVSISRP